MKQFSTESDGPRSCKIRPIDDYTESLVNLTHGADESIVVHGIDFMLAAISYRLKALSDKLMPSDLCAETIDLRKAYKQLPVSEESLSAAYLCVKVPNRRWLWAVSLQGLAFWGQGGSEWLLQNLACSVGGWCKVVQTSLVLLLRRFLRHWKAFTFQTFNFHCWQSVCPSGLVHLNEKKLFVRFLCQSLGGYLWPCWDSSFVGQGCKHQTLW